MPKRSNLDLMLGGADAAYAAMDPVRIAEAEVTVGAYERISDDQEDGVTGDRGAGVDRQAESNNDLASLMKWTIYRHYPDNDVSAFKDVLRPWFEELLEDLESGVIDGIVVYDLDRLARRPNDLERIIKIYDDGAKKGRHMVFRTVHDAIDLSSPDGITLARVMIAFANKSSRDTSRRVAAQRRSIALKGDPIGGTRPFGWEWDREVVDLPDGTQILGKRQHKIVPHEAEIIREVATDIINGASLADTIRKMNDLGIKTARNNQWRAAPLKTMLLSPRLAGYRIHQGSLIVHPKTKEFVRGKWDPILDDETWQSLAHQLTRGDRAAQRRSEAKRSYLLSGIARCSVCQGPLHGNARTEAHFYYACKPLAGGHKGKVGCGKISASGVEVDRHIVELLKARMRTKTVSYDVSQDWEKDGELAQARTQAQALLAEYQRQTGEEAARVLDRLAEANGKAEQLRRERIEWVIESGAERRRATITPESFDALPFHDKRAYIKSELIEVIVMPSVRRGNRFDPDRLIPIWQ